MDLDRTVEDNDDSSSLETIKMFVAATLFQSRPSAKKRYVSRCMAAMSRIKSWLQKLADKIAAAQALSSAKPGQLSEDMETVEFSRVSLIQQHELLGVILCRCIEKREADASDFMDFVSTLKKVDKYDNLLGQFHCHAAFSDGWLWFVIADNASSTFDPCHGRLHITFWFRGRGS